MRQRTALTGLALLLAIAGVTWLLVESEVFGSAELATDEEHLEGVSPEDALTAERAEGAEPGATLTGREARVANPDAGSGPVEVLVLGPSKIPLPGVIVEALPAEALASPKDAAPTTSKEPEGAPGVAARAYPKATTDENGVAWLPNTPYDGTWIVRTSAAGGSGIIGSRGINLNAMKFVILGQADGPNRKPIWKNVSMSPWKTADITGPAVRLLVDRGMPFRLIEQSAITGAHLSRVPWAVNPQMGVGKEIVLTEAAVQSASVRPGHYGQVRAKLERTPGFVPDRNTRFGAWISPLAKELVAYHPQWPETEVVVTLPAEAAEAASRGWTVNYRISRMRGTVPASLDGFGRLVVRGLPFLPGEAVHLTGTLKDAGRLRAQGHFGMDDRGAVVLEGAWKPYSRQPSSLRSKATDDIIAELTKQLARGEAGLVQLQGAASAEKVAAKLAEKAQAVRQSVVIEAGPNGTHVFRVPHVIDSRDKEAAAAAAAELEKTHGRVRVFVRRVDGRPAAGALIQVGPSSTRLSEKGTVTMGPFKPGDFPVTVLGAGASFRSSVTVVAGETTPLELDAPLGGGIDVRVTDGDDNPLPFATVHITQPSKQAYCDVTGDVQRLDNYTDHSGRRLFKGVEVGDVTLKVRYGGRSQNVVVKVTENDITAAHVTLQFPEPRVATSSSTAERKEQIDRDRAKRMEHAAKRLKDSMKALKELEKRLKESGR